MAPTAVLFKEGTKVEVNWVVFGLYLQSPVVSYSYLGEYELYPAAVRVRTLNMYQVAGFKLEMMTLGALVRVDE